MPRFKVSAFWLLILAWIFLLVWIWWKGPTWTLYEEQWLKPLANRWLATAAWGIIALMWLTVRVMKRLQQLEKMQKQQREEAVDPLSVELNAQQRYLDRWLLRLQRYLDNRRFLWQLPWYMVIGPAGSGKTTLLREGFPSDIIYAPEGARGAEQRLYLTPHVGKQAVIFDIDGTLCAPADADTVRGFIAGIACSVAVASALWWWQVYPVQQQLLQVNDTAQGAATVWMASPELENYERRLQQLLDTSPVQPLETGMQMMRVADSRWPESLQQQQASTQWNEALKTRAQSSPQLRGWLQTRQDLHAFADLVMQREKEGLTLSYIKNVIWQAERGLGQETPVESLLTQYHDARAQKQNTDALEKQINERLEGVLSRWLLLKNNVMPEAATGTTAEK
ncbi:VasL domain-containing protein [Escherichia coli]|uniref:VasL domain-containing protein n=1 Tax=Escherichia coli TaxID=562 RepID=UPI0039A58ED0